VEDFFFAGTLLGRAFHATGEDRYRERLRDVLLRTETRQPNGLYWHCGQSPWFWGRGNAFAALGFAEALSHVADQDLLAAHLRHLAALAEHQDDSGLWRQVIDDPATDPEHSATTMIGYAIARGLRQGWLPTQPWRDVAERAWQGAAARIGANGEIDGVCIGTGPLDSRDAYVERPFSHGVDARGGAFSLWFAVELHKLRGDA
jgi:rhamnogalacturonyl hydrolase YesR